MRLAFLTLMSVVLVAAGALIFFDYRKIASKWTSFVDKWWRAGPVRRRFNAKVPSLRFFGALLIFSGLLLFVSFAFFSP